MDSISFILPAYNCESTIKESVDSIFEGNFKDGDEVILIDDASTDNTQSIMIELSEKYYPYIKLLKHNYNKGSAAAGRNTGIDFSVNEIIFCLDADNILIQNSISQLKSLLIETKSDIVAFGEIHYFVNYIENITHKWILKNEINFLDNINNHTKTPCPSGNYMFTKESWLRAGRYMEDIGGAYDSWAFGLRQLAVGCKMLTLPGTYYLHRQGYESTFIRDNRKRNVSLTVLQALLPFIDKIHPKDVNYITSSVSREFWFDKVDKRPIRLKKNEYTKMRLSRNKIKRLINRMSEIWLKNN